MPQGDKDWKEARRGKITASRFADVMAKDGTKRKESLINDVVDELLGLPMFEEEDQPWFRHGIELEPEARGMYEWTRNVDVVVPEFIVLERKPYIGCSPDGLVGDDGGLEIKSRAKLSTWLEKKGSMDSCYKAQVQGGMFVTGRLWWDFVSFHRDTENPNSEKYIDIIRIKRDEEYIASLEYHCDEVWKEVQRRYETRRQTIE